MGGNPQGLSKSLQSIGVDSTTLAMFPNDFGYVSDLTVTTGSESALTIELKRLFALRHYLRFDVFFFNYGETLFPQLAKRSRSSSRVVRFLHPFRRIYYKVMQNFEFLLIRFLGKIALVQYQGDDARQGDYTLANFEVSIANHIQSGYYAEDLDDLKRKNIARLTRMCGKIYALNPDLLHVLPDRAEFMPYSHISLKDWQPVFPPLANKPLEIVHAPSHRGVKGTEQIIEALEALRKQGFEFKLTLVEGYSHSDARKLYEQADLIIDQIYAGWYGGLAVEAMALGKPVAAYLRIQDFAFIPEGMREDIPILRVHPSTLRADLASILEIPRSELLNVAKKSRRYVEKWHDPIKIASRVSKDVSAILARC